MSFRTTDLWCIKSLNWISKMKLALPDPSTFTLSLITWWIRGGFPVSLPPDTMVWDGIRTETGNDAIDQEVTTIVRPENGSSAWNDMLRNWTSMEKSHNKAQGDTKHTLLHTHFLNILQSYKWLSSKKLPPRTSIYISTKMLLDVFDWWRKENNLLPQQLWKSH